MSKSFQSQLKVRVPFWAKWLGAYRAWKKAKADREAHAAYLKTPLLKAIIIGYLTCGGEKHRCHRWECYETPEGVRSVVYKHIGDSWLKNEKAVRHPLNDWVDEWKHGLRDLALCTNNEWGFTHRKQPT